MFFSAYSFEMNKTIHLSEDYEENSLLEIINEANYIESQNEYSYIYVFDQSKIINSKDLRFIDLTEGFSDPHVRPNKQKGCLVKSYNKPVAIYLNDAIYCILKIKTRIVLEYCKVNDIIQSKLFPNNDQDFIYNYLLSIPRKEFQDEHGKPTNFFIKQFSLPEYNVIFEKFKSPEVAYYSSFWVFDNIKRFIKKHSFGDYTYFKCKFEEVYYYFSKDEKCFQMPFFIKLLREHKNIILEFDNLFKYLTTNRCEYQKGIQYKLVDNTIEVMEITISWASKSVLGTGGLMSRFYQIMSDEEVDPIRIMNDCPCNDDDRHLHKLLIGKYIAEMLHKNIIQSEKINKNTYIITRNKS